MAAAGDDARPLRHRLETLIAELRSDGIPLVAGRERALTITKLEEALLWHQRELFARGKLTVRDVDAEVADSVAPAHVEGDEPSLFDRGMPYPPESQR